MESMQDAADFGMQKYRVKNNWLYEILQVSYQLVNVGPLLTSEWRWKWELHARMVVHKVPHGHSDCHLHLFLYAVADSKAITSLVSRHYAPIRGYRWLEKETLQSRETPVSEAHCLSPSFGVHRFTQVHTRCKKAESLAERKTNQCCQLKIEKLILDGAPPGPRPSPGRSPG